MVIWIFECNDKTQSECFAASLFGAKAPWPLKVRCGDLCLLYNYTRGGEHTIFGVFRAITDGAKGIEPKAWGGLYPYQVRVVLASKERLGIPRFNLRKFVVENWRTRPRVRNCIRGDFAQEVLQYYASVYTSQQFAGITGARIEEDIRSRYPASFRCTDGHVVRSQSELLIDQWLSQHHVYHEYERLTNLPEYLIPDFTVYQPDGRPLFIEFWGRLDDPLYQERRLRKCEAYVRHGCRVVELYPDDIKNLDFVLRNRLRKFGIAVTG